MKKMNIMQRGMKTLKIKLLELQSTISKVKKSNEVHSIFTSV